MATKTSRMNKTVSIQSKDNALWKKAAKALRYYQDESLGDYLTECLLQYVRSVEAEEKLRD